MRYTDPDGRELWGWVDSAPEGITCGWNDNAPQTAAGYHDWMDPASKALFDIDHAEVDMGNYKMRFWKGDYGSTGRFLVTGIFLLRGNIRAAINAYFIIGMAGGETGIYNNDGRGLGSDGGSLMSKEGLKQLGITNVSLSVKHKGGSKIASVSGLKAWPNVYNISDRSKKYDIYTETTYSFIDENTASAFEANFKANVPDAYQGQFSTENNGKNITIIWGKNE
ncbi:hypothetical protein [Treponema zioleckii]|uniref:hypothetical protein n=1 Tax=Treponema zioleckii TaxID=331680 RepID=UPI00168ABAF5|nr:hypothetical protein [Treponema zioleckii]